MTPMFALVPSLLVALLCSGFPSAAVGGAGPCAKQDEAEGVDVVPVEGGDAMSFEGSEPEDGEPSGQTMNLEEEGPVTPAVRAVEPPPPAEQALPVPGLLEVRVTARRVVAEQIRLVPLEIRAPTSVRTLRGVTTMGELHEPERVEPGLFQAQITLPSLRGPAIILALFEGEGYAGYVRIAVWKAANLEVDTEPGAQVRVEIVDQTFGPVRAQGRLATVPVEIPPGAESARVIARDAAGNETVRTIELPRQGFPLAVILPPSPTILADDRQVLPVLVGVSTKWGGQPTTWALETDTGALGEPAEIATGLRLYSWRPSRALGEKALIVTQDDGETRFPVMMTSGPATGIEIQAEPNILPANGLSTATIYAGVSDGLGHYLDVGPIAVDIAGGLIVQPPEQSGPVVLATVAAERMVPGSEPPAAIVVTARGGGYEGVVAIRQFDPDARGLRLSAEAPRLTADGESRTNLHVELLDGLGEPLPVTGAAEVSALGGSVPAVTELIGGVATFVLQAGTAAGLATVRVSMDGAVAHATVALDAGPPDHLRVEVVPDPAGGAGALLVRARLEDRFGNGVGGNELPPFRGTTDRGALGEFAPVDAADMEQVGWRVATLTLPPDEAHAADVTVEAGAWSGRARSAAAGGASLYIAAMSGYLHNLGDAGFIPVRLGVGWMDAFGARGFLFGAELGYLGLRYELAVSRADAFRTTGDSLTVHAIVGYRWAVNSWFAMLFQAALGMEVAWFAVEQPGGAPELSSGASIAFSAGLRVGVGFAVGPGLIVLDASYDDARYDGLVRGNVGGLGGLLGYRLEL
jgi:hypothetical protein